MSEPVTRDVYSSYEVEWYCEPPEWGASFQTVREEWHFDGKKSFRKIFEWKAAEQAGTCIAQRNIPPKSVKK